MKPETLELINAHALEAYPNECCGLVVAVGRKEQYVRCTNIAQDPRNDFQIPKADQVEAENLGEILYIAHSHPDAPARPSDSDRRACEASGVPWVVVAVHTDPATPQAGPYIAGSHIFAPSGYRPPLRGRAYKFGTQDCYTLIQDYYAWELGITLPDFERTDLFWERGEELYLNNFHLAGFTPIPEPSEKGDVILMTIRSEITNHGAIWLAEGADMLHHPYGHLSERTVYGGYWLENTKIYLRKTQ